MRRRYRRRVTNYFTAAILELIILAVIVIVAQPQLRLALLEIVSPVLHESGQRESEQLQAASALRLTDYNQDFSVPSPSTRLENIAVYSVSKPPIAPSTPLVVSDWNIAAAAQSPLPLSGWMPAPPVETAYRETYPPPFGTQSPWK